MQNRIHFAIATLAFACVAAWPAPPAGADSPAELAADQAELARKFDQLETLAKRIAELTEADDPARAEQLRGAIRKSQELALPERFRAIVEFLEQEQLAAATKDQTAIAGQLQVLLQLLLADPDQARDEAERKRLEAMLKEIDRHIRSQQDLRRATLGEGEDGALAERQAKLADEVEKLQKEADPSEAGSKPNEGKPNEAPPGEAESNEGKPSEGKDNSDQPPGNLSPGGQPSGDGSSAEPQSPTQRAAERIAAAEQRMREAVEELEKSRREGAEEKQAEAQRRLEDAREEIEQALRQLREEELRRRLTQLATRLRRMLAEQIDVRKLTAQTEEDRPNRGRRATAIAAAGLANREDRLVATADGALRLLQEDGASVAFPEVVGQVRDDMQAVAERLRKAKLSTVTQRLEDEIIESLEEAIASLDKTIEDLEQRKNQGQQGQPGGSPGEPPVVDKLAELRMIRAIQARILRRTRFWDEVRDAGEAAPAEADAALQKLADREQKIMRAIRNLGKPRGQ